MQRITEDHDLLIQRAVAATGRRRQDIVNDAMDAGMTLVLLHRREPHLARALMDEAARCTVQAFTAPAFAPGDPGRRRST